MQKNENFEKNKNRWNQVIPTVLRLSTLTDSNRGHPFNDGDFL